MSRVEEIKAAIEKLTPQERCELAAFLNPVEDDDWDREVEVGSDLHFTQLRVRRLKG